MNEIETQVAHFLIEKGPHADGITFLPDARCMSYNNFEDRHDLIQWMFPTTQASQAQPHSPVLTWEGVQKMKTNPVILANIQANATWYLAFLHTMKSIWLVQYDHNHLRITRAIQCLSLFLGEKEADKFRGKLCMMNAEAGYPINIKSVEFWKDAVYFGAHERIKSDI